MEILTNSRFITHPSLVDKSTSHTVLVVDATEDDIENIGLFCKASNKNYDVYLYRYELDDLEWLNSILKRTDTVLQKTASSVTLDNISAITFNKSIDLLEIFENFDKN